MVLGEPLHAFEAGGAMTLCASDAQCALVWIFMAVVAITLETQVGPLASSARDPFQVSRLEAWAMALLAREGLVLANELEPRQSMIEMVGAPSRPEHEREVTPLVLLMTLGTVGPRFGVQPFPCAHPCAERLVALEAPLFLDRCLITVAGPARGVQMGMRPGEVAGGSELGRGHRRLQGDQKDRQPKETGTSEGRGGSSGSDWAVDDGSSQRLEF
jgi:hypothetical protein